MEACGEEKRDTSIGNCEFPPSSFQRTLALQPSILHPNFDGIIDSRSIEKYSTCLTFLPVSNQWACVMSLRAFGCSCILFLIVLNPTEQDIQMLLAAQCHLGTKNVTTRMTPYVYKRRPDGKHGDDGIYYVCVCILIDFFFI